MQIRRFSLILAASLFSAFAAIGIYKMFEQPQEVIYREANPVHYANLEPATERGTQPIDLTYAASITTPAVVHIRNTGKAQTQSNHPLYYYFREQFDQNQRQQPGRVSFGSGVIISPNGYIVTNNHVVDNGVKLDVTLSDNSTYQAEVIGVDPSTDLALIKIEGDDLPFLNFANSDDVQIGEWVMAAGNPFNFSSTVTAGIVSAKGRSIDILDRRTMPIESFIQTDAAVNKGNSGGALVNVDGDLIGINTAIVSPSGTYAGYSFAVPSNIVQKVVEDIQDFGVVQRALLGIQIMSMNSELADKLDVSMSEGIYVDRVNPGSAASEAGLEPGDIITHVNGRKVKDTPALQEQVAAFRPGDDIEIGFVRNEKKRVAKATLKNKNNTTDVIKKDDVDLSGVLAASIVDLTPALRKKIGRDGVQVQNLRKGVMSNAGIKEGFIITKMNNKKVKSVDDVKKIVQAKGGVMVEGFYPNDRSIYYYAFGLDG